MEIDILDSLEQLGYTGPLRQESELEKALELGPKSISFTELASWLSKNLKELCSLEDHINPVADPEDSSSFLLEVSSFLKELNCPHDCLVEGAISQRLVERKNRVLFLDYLCSELQAAQLIAAKQQHRKKKKSLDIELGASPTAACLENLLHDLGLNIEEKYDSSDLFAKFCSKIDEASSDRPNLIKEPALENELSQEQWNLLEKIQKDIHAEYRTRREMLLTRLDVTIQSFKWGESSQGKGDVIAKIYMPLRAELKLEPDVKFSDILSARKDVIFLEKTSSADLVKNTKSSVNRVVIGSVPDRGGRPKEQRPPVEMPNFRNRSRGGGGGGHGGGHGSRHFRGKGKRH